MLAVLANASPVVAAPADGLLVFQSDRGGQLDLWTMRADGSGATRLTDDKVADVFPEYSPSGRMIAWSRGDASRREVWVMDTDGTNWRQVTVNTFRDDDVVWSPDSSRLAYRSVRDGNMDIYVIGADGTGERRLTAAPGRDLAPDWSPDGSRITFSSDRSGALAVYSMSAVDGGDVRKLTPDSLNGAAARYSPDGSLLAFADGFCDTCGESDLWVMAPDGSGLRQVTNTATNEIPEAWSRNGARLVVDFARLSGNALSKGDIAVVTVATGATVALTSTTGIDEGHADWQP